MVTTHPVSRASRCALLFAIMFSMLLFTRPSHAEGAVPAKFTQCPGQGWQLGQYVMTAACDMREVCERAGGNGGVHVSYSGWRFCMNANADGLLSTPLYRQTAGPASCPANSVLQVDGKTGAHASCACVEGFEAVGDRCKPIAILTAKRSTRR